MIFADGNHPNANQQKPNTSQAPPASAAGKYHNIAHSTTNATPVSMAAKSDDRLAAEQEHYNASHGAPNAQYTHMMERGYRHLPPQQQQQQQQQHHPDSAQYRGQSSMLLNTTQFPAKSPNIQQQQTLAMSPKPSPSLTHGTSSSNVGIGLPPAMMQAPVYASPAPVISQAAQPPATATHLARSHVLRENEPSPLLSENYDCLSDDDA